MAANGRRSNRASQGGGDLLASISVIRMPIASTVPAAFAALHHVRASHIREGEFRLPPAELLSLDLEQNPLTTHSRSPDRFHDPLAPQNRALKAESPWLDPEFFSLNLEKISVGVESFLLEFQYILLDR